MHTVSVQITFYAQYLTSKNGIFSLDPVSENTTFLKGITKLKIELKIQTVTQAEV